MPGGRRHRADAALALSLAAGKKVREAAAEAGVAERTVYRRLGQPEFRQQITELRGRMIDSVVGQLSDAAITAFQKLCSLMDAASEPVQLNAAKAILDQTIRMREFSEFDSRLMEMEQECARKLGYDN